MARSLPSQDQNLVYTCIATDSLFAADESTVNAQLSAVEEIGELYNRNCTLLASSFSPIKEAGSMASVFEWKCQDSPETAMIALNNCKLWVLFTDGKQECNDEYNFQRRLWHLRVDNYPCVYVLFGVSANGRPSSTAYQVCKETCSNASDALFLFHDIGTDQTYVFQAKGCFEELNDGRPTIEANNWKDCQWSQLRRFPYERLLEFNLPHPVPTPYADRLTIKDRTVMTNSEYMRLKATTDVGEKFALDRLQDIINKAAEKDTFVPRYSKLSLPSNSLERPDIDGQASHAVYMIYMNLDLRSMGMEVPESRIEAYRKDLLAANRANRLALEYSVAKMEQAQAQEQRSKQQSFLLPVSNPEETFFPGFVRAPLIDRYRTEYRGNCMLCNEQNMLLVFLLHGAELVNQDHLHHTSLPFVFNTLVICDACAIHFPPPNTLLDREIVAVLPLVSVIDNELAWFQVFEKVIGIEVSKEEVLMMVWKWLNTQLGYGVVELEPGIYKDALYWVLKDLGKWEDTTRNRRYDTKSICY